MEDYIHQVWAEWWRVSWTLFIIVEQWRRSGGLHTSSVGWVVEGLLDIVYYSWAVEEKWRTTYIKCGLSGGGSPGHCLLYLSSGGEVEDYIHQVWAEWWRVSWTLFIIVEQLRRSGGLHTSSVGWVVEGLLDIVYYSWAVEEKWRTTSSVGWVVEGLLDIVYYSWAVEEKWRTTYIKCGLSGGGSPGHCLL